MCVRLLCTPSVHDGYTLCLQVGGPIPPNLVYEGSPDNLVNIQEIFAGKKGVLIGVPGAFTPYCSEVMH